MPVHKTKRKVTRGKYGRIPVGVLKRLPRAPFKVYYQGGRVQWQMMTPYGSARSRSLQYYSK